MKDTPQESDRPRLEIYTDGACEPNPGPGGYAALLIHPKKRLEVSGGFRQTTNNRMEIFAAIAGLEMLKQPCQVTLYSDSQYLVDSIMKGWARSWKRRNGWRTKTERAANFDLWQRLLPLCEKHQVEFRWVRGHAGHAANERCDQLAVLALRQPGLPTDEGFENKTEPGGVRPEMQEGAPCHKCSTPVLKRAGKSKPGRDSYYEFHLWCPQCQIAFQVESARRFIAQTPSLL